MLASCKDADAPKVSGVGEECAIGTHVTHRCSDGLTCKEEPYTPLARAPGEMQSPEKPSDVGGSCGGVAGFHCGDGLVCDMTPEQQMTADGMGSCARESKCR